MRTHHSEEEKLSGKICSIRFPPLWKNKKIKKRSLHYLLQRKPVHFLPLPTPSGSSFMINYLPWYFPSSLNLSSLETKVNLSTVKPIFCTSCLLSSRCHQITRLSSSINNLRTSLCLVFISP